MAFTPLAEQLDPEELRDIQAAYFTRMSREIEHYGGTVEKYAGDAILALFGTPVAHEDDAERAVLCALGMQEAIVDVAEGVLQHCGVRPAIRVGVNTGEVVAGLWEVGGREDVLVTGDAVNTAARLQAAAKPREVLVGAETMRLTHRRIRYGPLQALSLKGKTATVAAYRALARYEREQERWEGHSTPFVGRDEELLRLLENWARVQSGEGQLVRLIGDAGVGKSRLVAEFLEKIDVSDDVRVVRGRCLSYGQGIGLWLIADLLRSLFGVREQDDLDEVRRKLKVGVDDLLAPDALDATPPEMLPAAVQAEALDVMGEVLGLSPGGSVVESAGALVRRQALIRSLRRVMAALAGRMPILLILEDLHWVDEASSAVLHQVLADVPGLRILVLAGQRPGWKASWSEWGWVERITVRPLAEREAVLLAGAVLGSMALSPELEEYVTERAGGNPFFVEEMLRALQETDGLVARGGMMYLVEGAADRLPTTLTEVLLARLDRLEAQVRSLAQVASVIGRSFAVRLLAQVVGRETAALEMPLTALQQAEIAFPRERPDLEYVFKHVSMREVAYNTLVYKRREQLHLQTARAIAALYPSDEYVEMIAYHYAHTEEDTEAVLWLERAGDRAAAIYASEAALTNYRAARHRLERAGAAASVLARLDEKLGDVLYVAGRYDEALDMLERAETVLHRDWDLEGAGRITARIGMTHRYRGTPEEGIMRVQPMVDLLHGSSPPYSLALLHLALANLFFLVGRYADQRASATAAAGLARAVEDDRLLGEAEERLGTALVHLGETDEARRVLEAAIPLIERGGDLTILRRALNNLAFVYWRLGQPRQQKRYMERALDVAERVGNPDQTAFILGNLGEALLTLGDWEAAREHLERSTQLIGGRRSPGAGTALSSLALLHLWEGDWDQALYLTREALTLAEASRDDQLQERTRTMLAMLDLLQDDASRAVAELDPLMRERGAATEVETLWTLALARLTLGDEQNIRQAEELALLALARTGRQPGTALVEVLWVYGMVLTAQGRWEEAESAFTEGLQLARPMPYPYGEGLLLHAHGLSALAQGKVSLARQWLQAALDIFRALGAQKDRDRTELELGALSST